MNKKIKRILKIEIKFNVYLDQNLLRKYFLPMPMDKLNIPNWRTVPILRDHTYD